VRERGCEYSRKSGGEEGSGAGQSKILEAETDADFTGDEGREKGSVRGVGAVALALARAGEPFVEEGVAGVAVGIVPVGGAVADEMVVEVLVGSVFEGGGIAMISSAIGLPLRVRSD
jgi:hypothetical protein